ncbi:uncharacterized protein TM35_000342510 [Trypanosoma theileri]|uniref:Uncharacterized protein n=1 Tax=Trypanosoma theileri TaxID=67003 RepID=A0A1X0NNE3_9TRYP|nr:uncharacterized protein TM35_000342510 [Trypanosoma theileri]ORC85639.1 hypothetical protein TM35_000342510 [Trypanosoma theileri]
MDALQREVEALSAEVTRLRLMVCRMTTTVEAPSSSRVHMYPGSNNVNTNDTATVPQTVNMSTQERITCGSCGTHLPKTVPPEWVQLFENLVVASRDAAVASIEVAHRGGVTDTGRARQQRRSSRGKKRNKERKHSQRHRVVLSSSPVTSDSSTSCSSSSSSSSSSSTALSSPHRPSMREKKMSHRHQYRTGYEPRHRVNDVEEKEKEKKKKEVKQKQMTLNVSPMSEVRAIQVEESHGTTCGNELYASGNKCGTHPEGTGTATSLDVTSNGLASASLSQGILASFLGSGVASIPPQKSGEEEEEEARLSTDENGYPIASHSSLALGSAIAVTTVSGGQTPVRAHFKPIGLNRAAPPQRRKLLERLRETSDGSDESSDNLSAPRVGVSMELRSTSQRGAADDVLGIGSGENTTRSSGAPGVFGGGSLLGSVGGYNPEMLDECDFALQNSFGGSGSCERGVTNKAESSSPTLQRNSAFYEF